MKWAYGVTTVVSRKDDLLTRTLNSLCDAGFGNPRLFVDGCDTLEGYEVFGRPTTYRPNPPLRVVGNWMLGMWELYVRDPDADRYAMFQDDVECVSNLRQYLESCEYPKKGYQNLILHDSNKSLYLKGNKDSPWFTSNQRGLGACGLVFSRESLQICLSAPTLIRKPAFGQKQRSWKKLDGGILEGMKRAGWKEYVHYPTLLQHWGQKSTIGNDTSMYNAPLQGFKTTI